MGDDEAEYRRPSWGQLLMEGPAAVRLLAAQAMPARVRDNVGRGRAVIVVPAFLANEVPTAQLKRALRACGFRAFGWGQGFNMGARPGKLRGLIARIDALAAAHGPVALVGWSLGGLYAREAAKRRPDKVRMVATLGTPFSGGLRANNAWKLYEAVNDHDVDHPPVRVDPAEKPPVPTLAFWSRRDGIVAVGSARGKEGERDRAIELHCRHNALVSDTEALRALVRALAEQEGEEGEEGEG